jgi:DNA-binding GntR family transcriptional regulator
MLLRPDSSTIAAQLRTRICLMQSSGTDITLHEGNIAREFGVSRTPIRQVLQKLAYERLVETRSGVGTIVSPLHPVDRERDLVVLNSLFRAAATCCGDTQSGAGLLERLAAAQAVAAMADPDAQGYLSIRTELLEIASDVAPDTILGDAIRAAHWRHIRWRMADHAWSKDGALAALVGVLRAASDNVGSGGLGAFYTGLADAEL